MHAGAGADVDDIVGLAHRVLVVFDDDQRVAQVAQAFHGGDELVVVALVQADARLVQHIEHTRSARWPIWVARRMRWLSPPESDAAPRESVR